MDKVLVVRGRSYSWPGLCWRATRGTEAGGARSGFGACPPRFKPGTPALVSKRFFDFLLPGITPSASQLDWRLRLAGGQRLRRAAGNDLLSVAGGNPPEHLKMFSLTSDPSKPGAGATFLTGGTRTCQLQGRFPGPVLDATLPSSPVFAHRWMVSDARILPRSVLAHAASTLRPPLARVLIFALALALTFARQDTSLAPAGTSPCSTYLHKAISSLRAKATIPTLRARLP